MSKNPAVEEALWNHAADLGEGMRYQYRSWMFHTLAAILAYYKYRGTEPADMLSAKLLAEIEGCIKRHEEKVAAQQGDKP